MYATSPDMLLDEVQVPFEGVKDAELHVVSNLDLGWRYLVDQSQPDPNWLTIKSIEEIETNHWLVKYDAKSILDENTLSRRVSKLSFYNPEAYLGKYITFRQGYTMEYSDSFDVTDGEEVIPGNIELSGKYTYTTEKLSIINKDYYNYVSFNAYAVEYDEYSRDNITLNVTVNNGPSFKDINRKTYVVDVPVGTQPKAENFHYVLMWNKGEIMGPETTLTFSLNDQEGVKVVLDNLQIFKVSEAELNDLADEEYSEDEEEWI